MIRNPVLPSIPNSSARLENLVACSLLKEIHFREDVKGEDWSLHYIRSKDKKEVDFLIAKDNQPHCMIEVKSTDDNLSKGLLFFSKQFSKAQKIQLVHQIKREKTFPNGIEIRKAGPWLSQLDF